MAAHEAVAEEGGRDELSHWRPSRDLAPTMDGERLLSVFKRVVEPIGRSLPGSCEIVLHDLSKLPNSIVAIYGDVTDRHVGDPATDLLLKFSMQDGPAGSQDAFVGYETELPDGRRIKSSTVIIRDVNNTPVAALCINNDMSIWQSIQHLAGQILGAATTPADDASAPAVPDTTNGQPERRQTEAFVHDVDELASLLIDRAIREVGVPIDLMRKKHKLTVVRSLKARGIFLLRDAVEQVAKSLHVTRFTIYNYLNQLNDEEAEETSPTATPSP